MQLRDELRPDETFWKAQRRRFTQRMDQMLHQIVTNLNLESELKSRLVSTRRLALAQWFIVLPILLGGCFFAGASEWWVAFAMECLGLTLGVAMWVASAVILKRARLNALQKLAGALPDLRGNLSAQLREDVHNLYDSFRRVLEPTRTKLWEQERRQSSFNEQIGDLVKNFQTLEGELRTMAAAGTS